MLHAAQMELRHLRYFVAVAEALHFSRAAERLHLTQPALSRQIRDLEEDVGVKLFLRHRTQTRLTKAGGHFLDRAREILALTERSVDEVKSMGREVRLGHYGTLWIDYFGPALRTFARRFPKITLKAVEQTPVELVDSLRSGEIDLALLGPADEIVAREFSVCRAVELPALIAMRSGHPLAKHRKLALQDLGDAQWIVWDERDFPGRLKPLREAAEAVGFIPRLAGRVDSVASLFVQLANSDKIGYVLPMTKKLPHDGVAFSELKPPGINLPMDVAWRRETEAKSPVLTLAKLLTSENGAK